MQWNDFISWLRERGVLHLIPGLFARVDDFDVWVDDEDGRSPVPESERHTFFDDPLFCFAALDADERLHLIVVEASNPVFGHAAHGIDYRLWTEVVMERLAPHRLRMTLGRVDSGQAGALAAWMERHGLMLPQLAIL